MSGDGRTQITSAMFQARLFDVLGERVVIVIDGMRMYYSVGMPMRDDMAVMPAVMRCPKAKPR